MAVTLHVASLLFVALTRAVPCDASSDAQALVQQAVRKLHAGRRPLSVQAARSVAMVLRTMSSRKTEVICPFLAALVSEGVIYDQKKEIFHEDELFALAVGGGLSNESAAAEMVENFVNIPTRQVNIYDMEGNINEHRTSTGINDCATCFPTGEGKGKRARACVNDSVTGAPKCPTPDKTCLQYDAYKRAKFEQFWSVADANKDCILSKREACEAEPQYEALTNDANSGIQAGAGTQVLGSICGSYGLLIEVFGETCDGISRRALELVLIDNVFPPHYRYPSERRCC